MVNELIGKYFRYTVDTSYGINQDGYIAIGTESVVYKGVKSKADGNLRFSCVLKFKPKAVWINGEIVNRIELFKNEEWRIFEELKECRSIVKIDDVIEDLGEFSLPCDKVPGGFINGTGYFCVIEEYIDGWNLDDFCRNEYWKLRREEPVGNGLSKIVSFHEYGEKERRSVLNSYNYVNILKYQNIILRFMLNLCEIMQFVTDQKNILHLDIKPENIMVTRYGKELVLIDFGKSMRITKANPTACVKMAEVDYNGNEHIDRQFQHGTLGYAAPECYAPAAAGSEFPFKQAAAFGRMSLESDMFSFGATFWECLSIFELVTKSSMFSRDSHDFYRNGFLNDGAYCLRDLSCTSPFYHKKIESILKKCTRKRSENYRDGNNERYYHSYAELKKDLEDASDSVPTIVREENVRVKKAFALCGTMLAFALVFLIIFFIYKKNAYSVACAKWEILAESYNDTKLSSFQEISAELMASAPAGETDRVYEQIAAFTYSPEYGDNNSISEYEAETLISLLADMDNKERLAERVNIIMQHADSRSLKNISRDLVLQLGDNFTEQTEEALGFRLAQAIYNVEVNKKEIADAYMLLTENKDNTQYTSALAKIKNLLDSDENIETIVEAMGTDRIQIKNALQDIVF